MSDFILWIFVTVALGGFAKRMSMFFKWEFTNSGESILFCSALGLGIGGYGIFMMGSVGLLYQKWIASILVFFLILGTRDFLKDVQRFGQSILYALKESLADKWILLIAASVLVVVFFTITGALAPPTGQDELSYHLVHPKLYAQRHAVFEVPYSTPSLWPYLMEMLFTLGLLLKGPGLSKLFHFSTYLLTAFAVYQWASHAHEKRTAFFSTVIYLLTPAAFIQSTFAYVDNAVALFICMGFYSIFLWLETRRFQWAVLSGVFTGLALSTKFLALFMLPIIGIILLTDILRFKNRRKAFLGALSYFFSAVLCGGIWYARAYRLRGNPVFPFFDRFFGGLGERMAIETSVHGMGQDLSSFLLLLWNSAMHPERFGGEHVGTLYLIAIPLFLIFFLNKKPGRFALIVATAYTVFWFITDQNIRFLLPAFALLAVPAGSVVGSLMSERGGLTERFLKGLFTGIFVMQALFAVYRFKDQAEVFLGFTRPESYLSSHERTYSAAQTLNRYLKSTDKVLSVGEVRLYYFDAPFVIESELSAFTDYENKQSSPATVVAFLKERGFTHVLWAEHEGMAIGGMDEALRVPNIFKGESTRKTYLGNIAIVKCLGSRYVLYEIL